MAPQTRSQTAAQRSKRARDPSPERPSKRSKFAHDQRQSLLFSYPFVLPLVFSYLYDLSAVSWTKTCKAMKPIMSKFVLHRFLTQDLADKISDPSRMSYFQASRINSATHGDLRKHLYVQDLRFDDRFNSPLQPGCFNDRLRHVRFGEDFNQPIDGILPEGLDELWFGKLFNQPIIPLSLPSSITYISFSNGFSQPILAGVLPSSLETLILGRDFTFPILPGVLPPTLKSLEYRCEAQHPLLPGALPASLEQLSLGVLFNQPIGHGVLPCGLTHLTFSYSFNHPLVANVISNTVTHLTFGGYFDQVLMPGVIPSSVVQLQLGRDYQQPLLPNSLPSSIKHLIYCCNATECLDGGVLPSSIEHMEVGYYEKSPLPEDEDNDEPLILLPSMIPSSVKQLTIHRKFQVGTVLPSTITKLVFGPRFNEQIPVNFIPPSVTRLRFGDDFAQTLTSEMLPSSVKYLTLGECFEPRMLTSFPPHVTHLCFEKALSFDELRYVVSNVPAPTMHLVISMNESPMACGLILRTYAYRSSESDIVKMFTSWEQIDIEHIEIAKLQIWEIPKVTGDSGNHVLWPVVESSLISSVR